MHMDALRRNSIQGIAAPNARPFAITIGRESRFCYRPKSPESGAGARSIFRRYRMALAGGARQRGALLRLGPCRLLRPSSVRRLVLASCNGSPRIDLLFRGMSGRTPINAFIDGIRIHYSQTRSRKPPNPCPPRRLLSADYPLCKIILMFVCTGQTD